MIKKILILAIALFSIQGVMAQFTLDGEFRTRAEYRDGYINIPTDATKAVGIIFQRSRLVAHYKLADLETRISFQDARVWGEDKWKTDNMGVGLHEAWAKYKFNKFISLQVGRMELVYDDARLFTNGNWRTAGQSHDMARLMFYAKKYDVSLHIGYAVNNNADDEVVTTQQAYGLNDKQYKNMAYLWLNKSFMSRAISISLIGVYDGFQQYDPITELTSVDTVNQRLTAGAYLKFKKGIIGLEGAYYMQMGTDRLGNKINANFYNALATIKASKSIDIGVGYDHYSGSDLNNYTDNNTFENLTGPGHKFLGYMDYFGVASKHKAGINDIFAKLDFKINNKNSVTAYYHMFSLDQEYLKFKDNPIVKVDDKNLGSEIDLVYKYKASKNVNFAAGYSTMLYTESMESLKGVTTGTGNFAHFGWIQMTVKPNFFKYTGDTKKGRANSSSTAPRGRANTKAKKSSKLDKADKELDKAGKASKK